MKKSMSEIEEEQEFYTVLEFAQKIRIHPNTVRKGLNSGRIQGFRVGLGRRSDFRIPSSEIKRLCELDMTKLIERIVQEKIEEKNGMG